MLTCIIRYHIDPTKHAQFARYARNWGTAIPRCGADLIGYFAPTKAPRPWPTASTTSPTWPNTKPIAPASPPIRWGAKTTPSPNPRSSSCARTAPS